MAAEKLFEGKVKRFLQSEGIYPLGTAFTKMDEVPVGYYEKRWGSKFTKAGLPDLSISVNGHTVEVELKADNGKPSELQKFMIKQIREAGTFAIILYPKDFEEFKNFLKDVKNWGCVKSPMYYKKTYKNLYERGLDGDTV